MGGRKYPGVAPGPWMPQQGDVNNIMQRSGGFFSRFGSLPVQQLAAQMMGLRGRFLNNFAKGFNEAAKAQHQQYLARQEEMLDRINNEQMAASDAFAAYKGQPDKLRAELLHYAQEYQDKHLHDVITNQGLEAAEKFINGRENYVRDLLRVREQRIRVNYEEERAKREEEKAKTERTNRERREAFLRANKIDPNSVSQPEVSAAPEAPAATPESPGATGEGEGEDTRPRKPASEAGGAGDTTDDNGNDIGPSWMEQGANPGDRSDVAPAAAVAQAAPTPMSPAGQEEGEDTTGAFGAASPEEQAQAQTAQARPGAPADAAGAPVRPWPFPTPPPAPTPAPPAATAPAVAPIPAPAPSVRPAGLPLLSGVQRWAEDKIMGGKGAPKTSDRQLQPMLEEATDREVQRMRNRLEMIQRDPKYDTIRDPNPEVQQRKRQEAVLADVEKVSPRLAQTTRRLISGVMRLSVRQMGQLEVPLALAQKADPFFNANTPNSRADAIRYNTTGQGGRLMLSYAVVDDHAEALKQAAREWGRYQTRIFGGRRGLTSQAQAWYLENLANSDDPEKRAAYTALRRYQSLLDNVAPEIDRAIAGRAPTVSGTRERKDHFGPQVNADVLVQQIEDLQRLVRVREAKSFAQFKASIGNPTIDLMRMWKSFDKSGGITTDAFPGIPQGATNMEPNPVLPMIGGQGYSDHMERMINEAPPAEAINILRRRGREPGVAEWWNRRYPNYPAQQMLEGQ
jgi:hypothetical protein